MRWSHDEHERVTAGSVHSTSGSAAPGDQAPPNAADQTGSSEPKYRLHARELRADELDGTVRAQTSITSAGRVSHMGSYDFVHFDESHRRAGGDRDEP